MIYCRSCRGELRKQVQLVVWVARNAVCRITSGTVPDFRLCPLAWNAPVAPGVAAHAPIAKNYKPNNWFYQWIDSIKGMLKEQRSCGVLPCSAEISLLGWWPPQVYSPTFPSGNPVTALCSITSSTWWQLIKAPHILFFKVFILYSTFLCCLIWSSHFLALCLSTVRWNATTRWLAIFNCHRRFGCLLKSEH